MEKKKRVMIIVVTVLVLTIGVTFAYFMARTGAGASANANITADTVDDLKFSVSKDSLSLSINQFNFASGSGNLSDSITATASLKANSTKKTATGNYYVYFQIESNDYIYTTEDKKPEIVLTVTGPNGEITSLDNLSYVTATNADGTEIKGFDITELGASIIKVADSFEISSSSSTNYTNQDWTFTVTFINLDTNQADNEGKTLTGKVLIQKDVVPYHETCNDDSIACHTAKLYTGIQGEKELYYHNSTLENGAEDNSYRYAGANPNNYVCFGSDDTTCPTDNLYRIIGVFDGKIKLIKYDCANSNLLGTDGDYSTSTYSKSGYPTYKGKLTTLNRYYWNYKNDTSINNGYGSNEWSTSLLNITNLNTNYLNNIGTTWSNMIENTKWKVSGYTSFSVTPSIFYAGEITNATKIYTSKVGLMYVSDYGFAADSSAWTTTLATYGSSSVKTTNWMYMGIYEWTMSPVTNKNYTFMLENSGKLLYNNTQGAYVIRPVIYLKASVKIAGGDGSIDSPIRLT